MATLSPTAYFTAEEAAERLQYRDAASVRQLVRRLAEDGISVGTKLANVWLFSEADLLRMERFLDEHGRVRRRESA